MAQEILFKYSDFFQDDGGFAKVKADLTKTGDELIVEAKRIKAELAKSFSFDDVPGFAKLEQRTAALEAATRKYSDAKKALQTIESEYGKTILANEKIEQAAQKTKQAKAITLKKEIDAEAALIKGIKAETDAKKSKMALDQQEAKITDAATAASRKRSGAYYDLSAQLRELFSSAANVAAEMYTLEQSGKKASPEYARLAIQFEELQKQVTPLDAALKKIDGTLGRNQRHVGDYARGYDGLSSSVQQILREAPSAAVSLNTFFLAISNNLPILFDNIEMVNKELKVLKSAAADAGKQLNIVSEAQKASAATAKAAETAFGNSVNSILASSNATKKKKDAVIQQIIAQNAEITSNGFVSASTLAKTEALLLSVGATQQQIAALRVQVVTTEQAAAANISNTVALEAQTIATVEANAAAAKTPGILSQLSKSLFSAQTGLTLLVLGLTLFGGKIIDFITNMGNAKRVVDELAKSQQNYVETQMKIKTLTRSSAEDLKSLFKLATNPAADIDARTQAVKQLKEEFFFFFKQYSEGEILAGKAGKAIDKVNESLKAQATLKESDNFKRETEERIESIRTELAAREDYEQKKAEINKRRVLQERQIATGTAGVSTTVKEAVLSDADQKRLDRLNQEEKSRKELLKAKNDDLLMDGTKIELNKTILKLEEKISDTKKTIDGSREKAILLNIREEKSEKAKLDQQIKSVDFEASRFELEKTILQNKISNNEDIYKSDKYTLEQRLVAQKQFSTDYLALAELERNEALRQLQISYDKERTATIKDNDGKVIALKYTNQALFELEKQYLYDVAKIREDFRNKEQEAIKKGEQIQTLDRLKLQLDNVKYLRNLSTTAAQYDAYASQIKTIQDKINQIINQGESLELTDKITINEFELKRLEEFNQRIIDTFGTSNFKKLTTKQRKQYLNFVKAFEKEKSDIEADAEIQRQLARIKAIEDEQKIAESEFDFKKLEIEKQAILTKLKKDEIKRNIDGNKTILDNMKDFTKEWKSLLDQVLDKIIEVNQKRIQSNEEAVGKQETAVTKQEERARLGLDNTLAYEQKTLAKREADLLRSQKKQERLEKVKALYSSYSNYSSNGDKNPFAKAVRDFVLLEAFAASLGDGGALDDVLSKVPTNGRGVIRGRSHQGKGGGIPVLVEGNEGIFSKREMGNLGKENFYAIKERAGLGKVDSNFFGRQRKQFVAGLHLPANNMKSDREVVRGLESVKNAIEAKPSQQIDIAKFTGDVVELVETLTTPRRVIKNTFIIKKRKF